MSTSRVTTLRLLALALCGGGFLASCSSGGTGSPDVGSTALDAATCTTLGTESCACRGVDPKCNAGLRCDGRICLACAADAIGCACPGGSCSGGLVCDSANATCRAARDCGATTCGAHQRCEVSTGDARCTCEAGYAPSPGDPSICIPDGTANCDPAGTQGSILEECRGRGHACESLNPGARCATACLPDQVVTATMPANCRPRRTCASSAVTCTADHRGCIEGTGGTSATDARCGACIADHPVEVDGACFAADDCAACDRQHRACAAGATAVCGECASGYVLDASARRCIPDGPCDPVACAAAHRQCGQGDPSTCGACAAGYLFDLTTGVCRERLACGTAHPPACTGTQTCTPSGDPMRDDGCSGLACPSGQGQDVVATPMTCRVCAFAPTCSGVGFTGNVLATADHDGGECRCEPANGYYSSANASSGACDADGDGFVVDVAQALLRSSDPYQRALQRCSARLLSIDRIVLDNGQQERSFTFAPALDLVESPRNDGAGTVHPSYGQPANAQAAVPSRLLNSFTKLCSLDGSTAGDYNDNGISDVREWSGESFSVGRITSLPAQLQDLYATYRQYAFYLELHEGAYEAPTGGRPASFRIRERGRDPNYAPGTVSVRYFSTPVDPLTMAPTTAWAACARGPDAQYTGANVPSRANGDFTDLWPGSVSMPGMTQHSQYKCVEVMSQSAYDSQHIDLVHNPERVFQEPQGTLPCTPGTLCRRTPPALEAADWSVNSCTLAAGATSFGTTCQAQAPTATLMAGIYWAAVNYENAGDHPYSRGCANECHEIGITACPNYVAGASSEPGRFVCDIQAASRFGDARCGCGINYSGPMCETACPGSDLLTSASYEPATQSGFWMCAHVSASDGTVLSNATYELVGEVPAGGTDDTVLGSPGGYQIQPN